MAELKLICMSDIQIEDVDWLWEPYLPSGTISLIQGDGGTGKTTLFGVPVIQETIRTADRARPGQT